MTKYQSTSHKNREANRILQYEQKHMQSDLYQNLDDGGHEWLRCNIDPKKASAINMQQQMIETRECKKNRGMNIDSDMCR